MGDMDNYYNSTAAPWRTKAGNSPLVDGFIITHVGVYGVRVYRSWTENNNPNMKTMYERQPTTGGRNGNETDLIDRELTLVPRGSADNSHVSSLNNFKVPSHLKTHEERKQYVYDSFRFGGFAMEGINAIENGAPGTVAKSFTNITGGKMTVMNKSVKPIPPWTYLVWTPPNLDSSGMPVKSQTNQVSPYKAEILFEPYETTVGEASRAQIHKAMRSYAETGRTGPCDHPLAEGSAHAFDAALKCAMVVFETLDKETPNQPITQHLTDLKGLIGKYTDRLNNKRNVGGEYRAPVSPQQRKTKVKLVENLFYNRERAKRNANSDDSEIRGEPLMYSKEFQSGNAIVDLTETTIRTEDTNRSRIIGYSLEAIKPGHYGDIVVGHAGYSSSC